MVDEFVVLPMIACPAKDGVLERGCTEQGNKKTDWPGRLKGAMRIEPMITESDAQSRGEEINEKQPHLKPIKSLVPNVEGNCCDREQKNGGQKQCVRPMHRSS
jgi:hypothetical protein